MTKYLHTIYSLLSCVNDRSIADLILKRSISSIGSTLLTSFPRIDSFHEIPHFPLRQYIYIRALRHRSISPTIIWLFEKKEYRRCFFSLLFSSLVLCHGLNKLHVHWDDIFTRINVFCAHQAIIVPLVKVEPVVHEVQLLLAMASRAVDNVPWGGIRHAMGKKRVSSVRKVSTVQALTRNHSRAQLGTTVTMVPLNVYGARQDITQRSLIPATVFNVQWDMPVQIRQDVLSHVQLVHISQTSCPRHVQHVPVDMHVEALPTSFNVLPPHVCKQKHGHVIRININLHHRFARISVNQYYISLKGTDLCDKAMNSYSFTVDK